jgi:trans-aconitate 2-methyltransferase
VSERPADWDAETYDRVADFQEDWGREVLARLQLEGNETVLDAGCGSGRVTRLLLDRLPEGRVIGVDGSPAMIEQARANLGEDRVDLRVLDLLDLDLDQDVDAVLSTATFHWILDHERLFRRLFAALRPGGLLETQSGGEGNIAEWTRAIQAVEGDERFAPYLRGIPDVYNFASVGDTEARLSRAGFEVDRVWLEEKVVAPEDPGEFIRTCVVVKHLDRMDPSLHDEFIDAVLGSMPRPATLRYVRLNISARRPA